MTIKELEDKITKAVELTKDYRHSCYLHNELWKNQESLVSSCYKVTNGIAIRPDRYLILRNKEGIRRVFRFTVEQLKSSPIHDMKVQTLNKHPHPEIKVEQIK